MKTFHVSELKERIDEFVQLVRENKEAIELTNNAGVIALLLPARGRRDTPQWLGEKPGGATWTDMDSLAAEIEARRHGSTHSADAVPDEKRDL